MVRILIFSLLAAFLLLVPRSVAVASDYSFDVTVSGKATVAQKLSEKARLFLRFNKTAKAKYWRELLDRRLAEVVWSTENDVNSVEETTSRYSTYLGFYFSFIEKGRLASEKEISLSLFEKHKEILTEAQKKFEYDSAWWLSTQHDLNTIEIFKERFEKF